MWLDPAFEVGERDVPTEAGVALLSEELRTGLLPDPAIHALHAMVRADPRRDPRHGTAGLTGMFVGNTNGTGRFNGRTGKAGNVGNGEAASGTNTQWAGAIPFFAQRI